MKNVTALFALAVFLLSSCQKASTETTQQDNMMQGTTTPSGTVVSPGTDEPFSAKFTYTAPDINNIFENQSIRFESKASGVVQYVWKFDNSVKSTEKNPSISFPIHGYHTIDLTVTDKNGNTASSTQHISILCNFGGSH